MAQRYSFTDLLYWGLGKGGERETERMWVCVCMRERKKEGEGGREEKRKIECCKTCITLSSLCNWFILHHVRNVL